MIHKGENGWLMLGEMLISIAVIASVVCFGYAIWWVILA